MKQKIIDFLRMAFPFLIVVALWRLSTPFWNPAGILALIPIFFCTFVRPVQFFVPIALLFCFLIDYKANTLFFWTATYCLMYTVNGFQNVLDITHIEKNGIEVFSTLFGISLLILLAVNFSWLGILQTLWIFAWTCLLYMPITGIIKRLVNDR